MMLPLAGLDGASVELICHAADADCRAAAFGVPALSVIAATPRLPSAALEQQAQRWSILKQMTRRRRALALASTSPLASLEDAGLTSPR
jgi:hypothetical protein